MIKGKHGSVMMAVVMAANALAFNS